jgi:hypothetical protein
MIINYGLIANVISDNLVVITVRDESGNIVFEYPFTKQDINIIQQVVIGLSSYFNPDSETKQ